MTPQSIMLLTLCSITVFFVFCVIFAYTVRKHTYSYENNPWEITGWIGVIAVVVVGWGLIAGLGTFSEDREGSFTIEKNKNVVVIQDVNKGDIFVYDKLFDNNNITDTTEFKYQHDINMYGGQPNDPCVFYQINGVKHYGERL